jgi:hypothetical protein
MQRSGDQGKAALAALKSAPEMAAYWLIGAGASKAVEPLVKQAAPLVKAGVGALAATVANVLSSAGIRAVEGQPITPTVEGATQDALFGLFHGARAGAEAARSEGSVREALQSAPTEALQVAATDPEFRKSAPYSPKLIDAELQRRGERVAAPASAAQPASLLEALSPILGEPQPTSPTPETDRAVAEAAQQQAEPPQMPVESPESLPATIRATGGRSTARDGSACRDAATAHGWGRTFHRTAAERATSYRRG